MFSKKPLFIVLGALVLFGMGFFFLLKGCLARYDERFAHTHALYFENDGKSVVFSIVENQKTVSYSNKGGMIRKSVNTSYYIQANDANSGDVFAKQKVKRQKEIKYHPVEMLGASGLSAWVFIGELMAFDAFTMEKKADTRILEEKNPSIAGKFPKERQYYQFNRHDNSVHITATDGSKWKLNTTTLLVSPADDEDPEANPLMQKIKAQESLIRNSRIEEDSLYRRTMSEITRRYKAGEINSNEYSRQMKQWYIVRDSLQQVRDSLEKIARNWVEQLRNSADLERDIESLQRDNPSFSAIRTNQDTIGGVWYGLYAPAEKDKLYERVRYQSEYDETARRKFYIGKYSLHKNGGWIIDKDNLVTPGSSTFLAAGFLLDKKTGRPIHCSGPSSFLVVHKEQVGNEGKILLSRLGIDGKLIWTFNTQLTEWMDWIHTGKQLIVFGRNNKELSSGQCNILICVNLADGSAVKYDYFKDKKSD